jgi:pathogenesis-related protein 1
MKGLTSSWTALAIVAGTLATASSAGAQTGSNFTEEEVKQFVEFHNKVRADAGAKAVAWDAKVAAWAQEWADHLAKTGKPEHRPKNKYGENIYWGGGKLAATLKAAEAWASEIKFYDGGNLTPDNLLKIGHYTAMIWDSTKRIGAGKATTGDGQLFVVGNYDPPGNMFGRKPVLKPEKVKEKDPVKPIPVTGNLVFKGTLSAKEKSRSVEVELTAGTSYTITMQADDTKKLDPFVKVYDADNKLLAENDDEAPGKLNSRLVFTPTKTGVYRIVATSYAESGQGEYTLAITPGKK